MSRWQVLISAYLLSVPLPWLILQWLGIDLQYEQAAFWLVSLYSFPLWLVSEPLGVPALWVTLSLYWALALAIVVGWEILRRHARTARASN
jgi:hypothetical protein